MMLSRGEHGGLWGNPFAQFLIIAAVVLVSGMLVIGNWVADQIEKGVTLNAGAMTALYVDALIAPIAQDFPVNRALPEREAAALSDILGRGALVGRVSAFKLWGPDGRIVFSDRAGLVGQSGLDSPGLRRALAGDVHATFGVQDHHDQRDMNDELLLEVYSPVRSATTGEVIAVAEFYTHDEGLADHLFQARFGTWLVVGGATLAMFVALSFVYIRGSRTIRRQGRALDEKLAQLSDLLASNGRLSQQVEQAGHQIADLNERNLRRISAELHDGPVQLLSFAALRLDKSEKQDQVRQAIDEAVKEIRYICQGLALPEIEDWTIGLIAQRLTNAHKTRTGQSIALTLAPDLPDLPLAAKICVYRFIQEGLNNGAKHAGAAGQTVDMHRASGGIEVTISDDGPGFDPLKAQEGLGLAGLRQRVAALKGRFEILASPGAGTRLSMFLPVEDL